MTPDTAARRVQRALRWQERDGWVFWNGRRHRFQQIDQAPKARVAIKGQRPQPAQVQEPLDLRSII